MSGGLFNHPATPLQWGMVLGASLVAMALDVRSRRIPNLLTLPMLVAGLAAGAVLRGGGGLLDAFLGCLILGIPYAALFLFAGGGGGDAKLMGAIGAWLGVASGTVVLVAVMLSGAAIGLAFAASRGRLLPVLGNMRLIGQGLARVATGMQAPREAAELMPAPARMLKMPYGIAICAGVWLAAAKVILWDA